MKMLLQQETNRCLENTVLDNFDVAHFKSIYHYTHNPKINCDYK